MGHIIIFACRVTCGQNNKAVEGRIIAFTVDLAKIWRPGHISSTCSITKGERDVQHQVALFCFFLSFIIPVSVHAQLLEVHICQRLARVLITAYEETSGSKCPSNDALACLAPVQTTKIAPINRMYMLFLCFLFYCLCRI